MDDTQQVTDVSPVAGSQTPDIRTMAVPEEHSFVLASGEQLFTLDQLSEAINLIDPDTFHHHVHEGHNDFANWIEGVFPMSGILTQEVATDLANEMRAKKGPLGNMIALEKKMRMLERAAEEATSSAA